MINNFPCSGEINYVVKDAKGLLEKLDQEYGSICSKKDYLDGLSFEFEDYRFNVRISNTEPLLRLNVETKGNHDLLKSKLDSIDSLIVSYNAK